MVTSVPALRIDVAELKRNHAATDEYHRTRLLALGQHIVRSDHVFGARKRERTRLGAGRDHDMPGFELAVTDTNAVGPGEGRLSVNHLDIAARHRTGKIGRDIPDHCLFAIDQRGPVEPGLSDRDVVDGGAFDVVQGMCLRRPAPFSGCSRGSGRCRRDRGPRSSRPKGRRVVPDRSRPCRRCRHPKSRHRVFQRSSGALLGR